MEVIKVDLFTVELKILRLSVKWQLKKDVLLFDNVIKNTFRIQPLSKRALMTMPYFAFLHLVLPF